MIKKVFIFLIITSLYFNLIAQVPGGSINGNFQIIGQTYKDDTLINASKVPEYLRLNSYANVYYRNKNFTAGIRYEGYLNTLKGYNPKNDGFGISYYFLEYQNKKFDFTFGNFYEQFGNGLILRTYEDKNIGYDNAINGVDIKFYPVKGIYLKGIIGRERLSFSKNTYGYSHTVFKGLVRGMDIEISPNELINKNISTNWLLGFGMVSKYQPQQQEYITVNDTTLKLGLPNNVSAFSARINFGYKDVSFSTEYAYKIPDPSADNGYIYRPGHAVFSNITYARKGLGILFSTIFIDNFSFRADRNAALNDLNINYIPDITRNHTYSFAAMYPYVSQNISEAGIAIEITKKFLRHTFLGGKYGTNLSVNYSRMHDLYKIPIKADMPIGAKGTYGYFIDTRKLGALLYQDFNIQVDKKVSKHFKFIFLYQNLFFNYAVLRGKPGHQNVYANTVALDMTYKFNYKHSLRTELQTLQSKQDMGSWVMGLIEYTIAPHWFFTLSDEYNYSNPSSNEAHYYNGAFGYKFNSTRIQLGYGRQREGIICIGGVCREVPAANGFNFVISSTF